MERAYSDLKRIINSNDKISILERKAILLNMVTSLNPNINKPDENFEIFKKAVNIIELSYTKDISISEIALALNISETHFRKLFFKIAGMSPKHYLLSYKTSKSKELLSKGIPIKDIYKKVGFNDIFHFMKTFKKITGINPGKFV